MKFLILLAILLNFHSISSFNFDCDVLKKELVTKNAVNIYIVHSYMITNNNSFNRNLNTSIKFPVNRTSYSLPKIYEHLNGLEANYSIILNDSYYVGLYSVAGTKNQLSPKFIEACGTEILMERFAVILIVVEPMSSIILFGCNIVTGQNIIMVMFESKTRVLKVQDLVKIDLNHEKHLFKNDLDGNNGSCMCNSYREYAAECLKRSFQPKGKDSVINNMFYIYISIIIIMISLLYVIHRCTESNDDT